MGARARGSGVGGGGAGVRLGALMAHNYAPLSWYWRTRTAPSSRGFFAATRRSSPVLPLEARAALEGLNPQNRLFQPAEVTAAALFLCGAGSEGINGQCITIAGGEV